MRVEFESIKRGITKTGKCKCGKKLLRSKTFEQTISPFNKNKEGTLKTRFEIVEELIKEAHSWQPDFICSKCADSHN